MVKGRDSSDQSKQALGTEAENGGEGVGVRYEGMNLVPAGFCLKATMNWKGSHAPGGNLITGHGVQAGKDIAKMQLAKIPFFFQGRVLISEQGKNQGQVLLMLKVQMYLP